MSKDIPATASDLVVPIVDGDQGTRAHPDGAEGNQPESVSSTLAGRGQRGMVSAEWAVGIVAAVAIAGVLLAVITSGQEQDALMKFILWVIESFVSVVK